jgi:hypothetical protein
MYNTVENKDNQFSRKQIQPEKRFTSPSTGISMPLTKMFWSLCYRNTKMAFPLPERKI